jgi:hypothetical protein
MAGYYRLSSFDQVAKAYEEIKPIRGARASEDLRPLAQRRYWWNRVHKVSDTKYILCDGHWAWSGMSNNVATHTATLEQTAPIVWERREDGDYMTVRSHMNDGMSVSRYTFLDSFLPMGMRFDWYTTTGKHFVKYQGNEYYLPKFRGVMDWQAKTFTMTQDNKLVFKHVNDAFERVGDLVPMQTRRIDKEVDSYFKPKMKEMWEWMQVVLPVMGDSLGDAKNQYASDLTNGRANYWYWERYVDKDLIREILDNPEHDKRMALAGLLAYKADAIEAGRFDPQKDSWAKFRATIRKVGGMLAVDMR